VPESAVSPELRAAAGDERVCRRRSGRRRVRRHRGRPACRLCAGTAARRRTHARGVQPTHTLGAIAGSVAVARTLRLSAEQCLRTAPGDLGSRAACSRRRSPAQTGTRGSPVQTPRDVATSRPMGVRERSWSAADRPERPRYRDACRRSRRVCALAAPRGHGCGGRAAVPDAQRHAGRPRCRRHVVGRASPAHALITGSSTELR